MNVNYGTRLKEWRKNNGLSQRALAKKISLSQGYISDIETGRSAPSREMLDRLSETFNLSTDWVLTGNGSPIRGTPAPVVEQAQNLGHQLQEALPTGFSENLETMQEFQALLPDNHDQKLDRAQLIDALPSFAPDESMAAVYEHPTAVPADGTMDTHIDQIALPRLWLFKRNITAPALVPVPDDDMAPTYSKGNVLLIDGNDTELDGTPDPMAITLDGKLCIRRLKPIEGWIILTADKPGTMAYEVKLAGGIASGLTILGRVKAVIDAD